ADRRPAVQEFMIVGDDGLHRRLLQHDLRQPDVIRIGALPRRRAPGQHARRLVVPGEEIGRDGGSGNVVPITLLVRWTWPNELGLSRSTTCPLSHGDRVRARGVCLTGSLQPLTPTLSLWERGLLCRRRGLPFRFYRSPPGTDDLHAWAVAFFSRF